ncbi:hypothetical protein KVR01_008968 [Diaporthe batatas]|uniref:uncharacterized protein n=1 Tax=Diaporthe batatas TaxID=748121 RepID=UPI001D04EA6A|nr:uncharacterized protein KVR01_008968 [Diaporthe batatas]KAG8160704.1 hypothetical protein KVR01_008968 [Diaporthe batatas]
MAEGSHQTTSVLPGLSLHACSWAELVVSIACFVLGLLLYRRYLAPLRHVPGPFWASLGRLWHTRMIMGGDQGEDLLRLHKEYGPFVRIANNEVSVCHPEAVKELILTPLRKDAFYKIFAFPDSRYKNGMTVLDPKRKFEHSRNFAPGYSLSNMLHSEDWIDKTIGLLMDWLDSYADTGRPMHLDRFCTFTSNDVTGTVLFSSPYGFLEKGYDIGNAIANNTRLGLFAAVAGHHWLILMIHAIFLANPVTTWLGVIPTGHILKVTMDSLHERESRETKGANRFDLLEYWLRTLRERPDRLDLNTVQGQTIGTVAAGGDATSTALQSFLYHMIRHPTAWRRLQDEIDAARKEGRCQDRIISFADTQKLPFLQMCIKEAMRVFAPVQQGLPRVAPNHGVKIGDREFPGGTILSVSAFVLHRSTDIWGPDANEFHPDRWSAPDIASKEKYFIPFGGGYNACPGQHLAKMEVAKICGTIVRDYEIRQVEPGKKWSYKAYFNVVPHSWPVYVAKRHI